MRNLIKLLLLATTFYVFLVSHMTASAQTQTDRPTETTDASTSAQPSTVGERFEIKWDHLDFNQEWNRQSPKPF